MEAVSRERLLHIASLFKDWDETMIWSCLQGRMGRAWSAGKGPTLAAQIVVADFCFFAGRPCRTLVEHFPSDTPSDFLIMAPQNAAWGKLIEAVYPACRRLSRYATKKEPDVFNAALLHTYLQSLPRGYTIRKIDNEIYKSTASEVWSRDLCGQFPTYEDYARDGLGFAVLRGEELVCGASSYTVYNGGIEIEIDTKEDHRRKGLALACAARLILECLSLGLYPSWDAANPVSLHLAEKLGYRFDREYTVYAVSLSR